MSEESKVRAALALLKLAGRMDLVWEEDLAPGCPVRRASAGEAVAVAVLLGHLNFACRVVRAGRTFCRRLALALSGQALPHHHVRLKVGVREDLRMWSTFLESFNEIPLKVWRECEWDVQLFSDAAGSMGFGLYWEGCWCAKEWPNEWKNGGRSIAFLELFPMIVAVCLWGAELRQSRVLFRVDNMAVVQLVNRQSAREARVLQLMHVFVLQCLRNDIHFRARHVLGVNNDIADALSHSQWERFHGLATGVALTRIRMPVTLREGVVLEVYRTYRAWLSRVMAVEVKVQEALRLLQEAGRMDLVRVEVVGALWPVRRAASMFAYALHASQNEGGECAAKWEGLDARRQDRGKGRGRGIATHPSQVQPAVPKRALVWLQGDGDSQCVGVFAMAGKGEEQASQGAENPQERTSGTGGRAW
ncbi:hypothetical protein NDU88_007390 [Pleurodeles waltl]|uniref:RNase H type-1 domain-containing protein n=1 Tax=Pleurodeles waltl TaxID=8319 RepID=A0AAV7PQ25_PLEWA|nr:hypothetical protein NDU88_007390 [Pleurodeles waltl]